tara:strand:- start:2989 stop:4860 length:1872 start_codon:yes stop_codon:yes gene_type:complete
MVSYEFMYPGADDSLTPSYKPKAYEIDIGSSTVSNIGTAMDARTANQLGELRTKINPGQKVIEIGAVQSDVWESIPKQHIDEMRRAMKLAGVKPSVHAPLIEASGYGKEGWEASNQVAAERQIDSAVQRSQRLDPDGNISVTVHSTAQLPEMIKRIKTKDGKEKIINAFAIDPITGRAQPLEQSKRFFREGEKFEDKQIAFNPQKEINKINELQWHNRLGGINTHIGNAENGLNNALKIHGRETGADVKDKEQTREKMLNLFGELQKGIDPGLLEKKYGVSKEAITEMGREANHSSIYFKDAYANIRALFDSAYSIADKHDKKILADFAKRSASKVKHGLNFEPKEFEDFKEVVNEGLEVLGKIKTPKTLVPLNDFVIKKSSETFANVAAKNFKKFKDKSPILNIENPPAGQGGLSRAEDLRDLIKASRKKLTKNLIKEGMGESEAKKQSRKLIGATWDVGHINMMRKEGYSEKDIIKQTEIIAPFVKHVHMADNFGFEHTELPMGMGNVPMKEIMKKLGEKGFEGKKIIEAGNWWQHFAEQGGGNPFKPTIEAFDSPIYAMKAGPSWGELPGAGGYYSGYGAINPAMHHQIYGAGFTTLPVELGGNLPGTQDASRFSGTPNQ